MSRAWQAKQYPKYSSVRQSLNKQTDLDHRLSQSELKDKQDMTSKEADLKALGYTRTQFVSLDKDSVPSSVNNFCELPISITNRVNSSALQRKTFREINTVARRDTTTQQATFSPILSQPPAHHARCASLNQNSHVRTAAPSALERTETSADSSHMKEVKSTIRRP